MDNIKRIDGELRELALFAGAGGGILGGILCGFRTVCAVEIDPYCRAVLCARQNEGILPPFPVWDDVRTFDGKPWRGIVDVVSGGFPCQDVSVANAKGKGLDGERSGLWSEMRRIIGEVRPRFILVENSPNIINKGGVRVVGDLTALGYDCKWGIVGAHHAGASHRRDRWWCIATDADGVFGGTRRPESKGQVRQGGVADGGDEMVYPHGQRREKQRDAVANAQEYLGVELRCQDASDASREFWNRGVTIPQQTRGDEFADDNRWWSVEPPLGRVANGVAHRVGQLRALGNGQVPAVVKLVWEILNKE